MSDCGFVKSIYFELLLSGDLFLNCLDLRKVGTDCRSHDVGLMVISVSMCVCLGIQNENE